MQLQLYSLNNVKKGKYHAKKDRNKTIAFTLSVNAKFRTNEELNHMKIVSPGD